MHQTCRFFRTMLLRGFLFGVLAPLLVYASLSSQTPDGMADGFPLEAGDLFFDEPARGWYHLEALGERAGMWGSIDGNLEGWVYPFKMFGGLYVEISADGGSSFLPLERIARRHLAAPHMTQLRLVDDRFIVKETMFVPRNLPAVTLYFECRTSADLCIRLGFDVSLAPMMLEPGSVPKINFERESNTLMVEEPRRHLEMHIWSPAMESPPAIDSVRVVIELNVSAEDGGSEIIPLVFALTWPGYPSATATIEEIRSDEKKTFDESKAHYRALFENAPQVDTPDQIVNAALRWSTVSLDQLRVKNHFLGAGLVSGYSSSGETTRPKYAWFFDEPTLSSWAFLAAGLRDHVREALAFLFRYQRNDGKVVHEIIQSLSYYPGYFEKYRWAYIHTDSAVYFLAACAHYYRMTGDIEFIRTYWDKITMVLAWCESQVDPGDGLIGIAESDWGSAESSFSVKKDTQLSAMWVRALRDMEYLSGVMNESERARKCRILSQRAAAAIEEKLWDEEKGTYYWGIDRDGAPLRSLVPHHAVGIWMGSLDPKRSLRNLERMARADFRSDWGVRSLALTDPQYDPRSYQSGTVWPVWNAGVIVADFRLGRQVDAFRNFLSMVRLRSLDGLGPMPEVLHGRFYKRLAGGVPHQMFSEIAVQNVFYDGLLGMELNVPDRIIRFAPRLPAAWNRLDVGNIPFGPGKIGIAVRKSQESFTMRIEVPDGGGPYTLMLEPLLPAGCSVRRLEIDGNATSVEPIIAPSGVRVPIEIMGKSGAHELSISHTPGYDFMVEDEFLSPGDTSRNLRLICSEFSDRKWTLNVEGIPGRKYALRMYNPDEPSGVTGGKVEGKSEDGSFRISLQAPSGAESAADGYVAWTARIEW